MATFSKLYLKSHCCSDRTIIFKIKNHFTVTANILCILLILHIFFQGDYASVDAMQKKAASDKDPDQMLYAELGAGGGRRGPKSEPMESNYAQVKVDEMGYPARGPASDMSEPPQYPTSINRDRSRRHSPPPHYGGLDDDDGVIV